MSAGRLLGAVAVAFCATSVACSPKSGSGPQAAADREALVAEVEALRDSVATLLHNDPVFQVASADSGHVMIGVHADFLEEAVRQAASVYLDTVSLHIEPNVVVEEGEPVRVRIGPVRVTVGSWKLQVTIERIEARLLAQSIDISMADSTRLALKMRVETRDGAGRANIDFEWDAGTVTSVVCRDFAVHERFDGVVASRAYDVEGAFVFRAEGGSIIAQPEWTGDRLTVSPQPTPESWERVREILARQNHIFRCGLALQPDNMERMLRELLEDGFKFSLPASILGPIPLPAAISESVALEGREYAVAVRPAGLWMTPEALWYSALVEVGEPVQKPAPPDEPGQSPTPAMDTVQDSMLTGNGGATGDGEANGPTRTSAGSRATPVPPSPSRP